MVDLYTTPPAARKIARAKAQFMRDDTIRALESLLDGLGEYQPKRTHSKIRYEVEATIRECVLQLNRQPAVRSFFESLAPSKNFTIPYTPGQEEKLRGLLTILHKGLTESLHSRQRSAEQARLQRKEMLREKGLEYLKSGDLPRGKSALRLLAEEYGGEPGLLQQVGEWLLEYKAYFEAAEVLEKGIEKFPKQAKVYALAIQCYRTLREMEKAEKIYFKAIQQFGRHPRTLLNLAKLYVEWNKREQAFQAANDAWKKDNTLLEAKEIVDRFS